MQKIKSFGQRLKRLRENAGMTQREAAELCGIERKAIMQIESDTGYNPSIKTVFVIAEAFDVSIDYLLCRTDEKRYTGKKVEVPVEVNKYIFVPMVTKKYFNDRWNQIELEEKQSALEENNAIS